MGDVLTPLIQKWRGALGRTGLVAVGTYLVDHGLATQDDWMTLSMKAAPIIVATLWGLYQKYHVTVAKAILRQLPAGATNAQVKELADKYPVADKLALALKDGTSL